MLPEESATVRTRGACGRHEGSSGENNNDMDSCLRGAQRPRENGQAKKPSQNHASLQEVGLGGEAGGRAGRTTPGRVRDESEQQDSRERMMLCAGRAAEKLVFVNQ